MLSPRSTALPLDADDIAFPFESPDNSELENRIVSPCGRFESFDYKGSHFEIDWDEIAPPGAEDEDEEEVPHEEVMEEMRRYCQELDARRKRRR